MGADNDAVGPGFSIWDRQQQANRIDIRKIFNVIRHNIKMKFVPQMLIPAAIGCVGQPGGGSGRPPSIVRPPPKPKPVALSFEYVTQIINTRHSAYFNS